MKVSMFHFMPHRDLPADFEKRYRSAYVDVDWRELGDSVDIGRYYNESLDELIFAAEAGLDGVCTNEHHQNVYGLMPNPNLWGAVLARATSHLDTAIVQLGCSLPLTRPPVRIAEEYAMIDCVSGGRLVAGMPIGIAMDANMNYGIPPIEQRDRYYEAHDLIKRAWTEEEVFSFNGKYTQLPYVNVWPKPIQKPHPPIWIPGAGSASTWKFAAENDYAYQFLSYYGWMNSKAMMDGFWNFVDKAGYDTNPFRAGFLQLVVVSETDEQAQSDYEEHIRYFYNKLQHLPPHDLFPPGHQDFSSLEKGIRSGLTANIAAQHETVKNMSYAELVERQFVIAGSPATVRDQLREAVKSLRIGNLMVLLHIGSMPHELTLKNIELFANEVQPHLSDLWEDEWENRWWPSRLGGRREEVAGADTSSTAAPVA